jgi:hypothetical protein
MELSGLYVVQFAHLHVLTFSVPSCDVLHEFRFSICLRSFLCWDPFVTTTSGTYHTGHIEVFRPLIYSYYFIQWNYSSSRESWLSIFYNCVLTFSVPSCDVLHEFRFSICLRSFLCCRNLCFIYKMYVICILLIGTGCAIVSIVMVRIYLLLVLNLIVCLHCLQWKKLEIPTCNQKSYTNEGQT